MSETAVFPLPV